MPYCSSPFLVC